MRSEKYALNRKNARKEQRRKEIRAQRYQELLELSEEIKRIRNRGGYAPKYVYYEQDKNGIYRRVK